MVNPAGKPPINHLHPDQEWYTTDVFTDYALHFLDDMPPAPTGRRSSCTWPTTPPTGRCTPSRPTWPSIAANTSPSVGTGSPATPGPAGRSGLLDRRWRLSERDAPDWDSLSDEVKDELDLKMALYAATIDCLDQNVGRASAAWKSNTSSTTRSSVFLSDNGGNREGEMFGYGGHQTNAANYPQWAKAGGRTSSYGQGWANVSNSPFRRYKRENHEGGISTPCIVHWPEWRREARHHAPDGASDPHHAHLRGNSAASHLSGEGPQPGRAADGRPKPGSGLPGRQPRTRRPCLQHRGQPGRAPRRLEIAWPSTTGPGSFTT